MVYVTEDYPKGTQSTPRLDTKELVVMSFLSALLFAGQVALAPIPNIEIVSVLIYIYSQIYRKKVFFIIYVFVLLEGCMHGFGLWWLGYLYVWSSHVHPSLDSHVELYVEQSCPSIMDTHAELWNRPVSLPVIKA